MPSVDEMTAILTRREELDPELAPWVEGDADTVLGPFLKHPLCYMALGNREETTGFYPFAAHANAAFKAKLAGLEEAMDERSWFAVVFVLYERPYRLYAFEQIEDQLPDEEWWSLLGAIWTDTENAWQNDADWRRYLSSQRASRDHIMEEEEREAFKLLPEELEVWRGYSRPERKSGMSWTLNRPQAEWFARRLHRPEDPPPKVARATVKKEHVIAYFTCRQESEIVVLPEHQNDIEEFDVERK